jgi:hypothetical protein
MLVDMEILPPAVGVPPKVKPIIVTVMVVLSRITPLPPVIIIMDESPNATLELATSF